MDRGYDSFRLVAPKVYHTFTIALQTSPRTASTTREGVTASREGYSRSGEREGWTEAGEGAPGPSNL
jgi:hypothetical protein